ncbi:MAG TPA: DsbA family protein [Acidimicrobiia bacterium]|nr:DsbA family protein [Acidimicrobiia bacterium]
MQHIEFYFDPSCPWCWVTSRWLTEVSQHRDISIEWLPFSLAIKNGELDGEDVTGHLDTHTIAHRVLRMIEAIHAEEGIDRGQLYSAFGRAYFIDKTLNDDNFMPVVLQQLGLDPDYINQADNIEHDTALTQHMDTAIEIVGDDVGVPLVIFVNEKGEKQGYFGPVLQGLPDTQDGLDLWDGLSSLGSSSNFFELKRARTDRSKVKSTLRLFEDAASVTPDRRRLTTNRTE